MSLSTKLQKLMESTVAEFCRRLAEQHDGLDVEALMQTWKDTAKKPKVLKKPRKVTAYMNFSQAVRADIKTQHPEMTFGEISQETSRRWKALSDEEKAQYAPSLFPLAAEMKDGNTSPSPVLIPSPASTNDEDNNNKTTKKKEVAKKKAKVASPKKATVAELKKQCKDKGLTIKGLKKREEFEVLLETCVSSPQDSQDSDSGKYVDDDEGGILA